MDNVIKIKRGVIADLTALEQAELGYCTDTDQVFIGDGSVNHEIQLVENAVAEEDQINWAIILS